MSATPLNTRVSFNEGCSTTSPSLFLSLSLCFEFRFFQLAFIAIHREVSPISEQISRANVWKIEQLRRFREDNQRHAVIWIVDGVPGEDRFLTKLNRKIVQWYYFILLKNIFVFDKL